MCKTQYISAQKDGGPLKKRSTILCVHELLWLGCAPLMHENTEEVTTHFPHFMIVISVAPRSNMTHIHQTRVAIKVYLKTTIKCTYNMTDTENMSVA
jgi:hypothetical protein